MRPWIPGSVTCVAAATILAPVCVGHTAVGTLAAQDSRPYGMAVDETDRIWLVETGIRPNRLVVYDTVRSEFIAGTDIPSGAGSIRHIYYDGERREVWFGTDANTVGRARLR